ncbi:hypothetical protein [Streptomyces sp. HNM0574]|uniref:hypothetical protein n=1 Tax=Streptomyces sp. HNM0574 TaxID=2714954 RepID=UPI00146BD692|nr:hypothetical protein [Streptomyces sp. HNM0574]NLU69287.1 hypothetical protein [Streptomyces sp. HNM0574]
MRATAGTLLVGAAACLTAVVANPAHADGDSSAILKDDRITAPDADALHETGQGVGYFLKALSSTAAAAQQSE